MHDARSLKVTRVQLSSGGAGGWYNNNNNNNNNNKNNRSHQSTVKIERKGQQKNKTNKKYQKKGERKEKKNKLREMGRRGWAGEIEKDRERGGERRCWGEREGGDGGESPTRTHFKL